MNKKINLSEFKKGYDLLFKFSLYKPIDIDLSIQTKKESEVIDDGDIHSHPFIIYHDYFLESIDFSFLKSIISVDHLFADYCPLCGRIMPLTIKGKEIEDQYKGKVLAAETNIDSTEIYNECFKIAEKKMKDRIEYIIGNCFDENRNICITVECTKNHKLCSIFHLNDTMQLIKIGQYPEIINFDDTIKKYEKVLDKSERAELIRALGLISYGVGVGSFVYLRRVFERLIYDSFYEFSKEDSTMAIDEFKLKSMDIKIDLLKDYLPDYLIDNKKLYKILSKGVHQLSEAECKKYFNTMFKAILIILEERIEKYNKKSEKDENKKRIQQIISETKD